MYSGAPVGVVAETTGWQAGAILTLTYDGTSWVRSSSYNSGATYTFTGGTNGFTVTPSGGTAQTVTVTPSITNNITGTGTNGSLAKFNGANTITNGPALSSAISIQDSTTMFLREDGAWAIPTYPVPHLYVTSQSGTTNTATELANNEVYLKLFDDTTVRESHKISGDKGIEVIADTSANIVI